MRTVNVAPSIAAMIMLSQNGEMLGPGRDPVGTRTFWEMESGLVIPAWFTAWTW